MKTIVSLKVKLSSGIVYTPVPQFSLVNWLTWPDSSSLSVYDPSKMPLYQVRPTGASRQRRAVAQLWRMPQLHTAGATRVPGSNGNWTILPLCNLTTKEVKKQPVYSKHRHLWHWGQPYIRFWSMPGHMGHRFSILLHYKSNLSPTQRSFWCSTHLGLSALVVSST